MIDFTNCPVNRFRAYGGANGNKINISYEGSSYMLKFPPRPSRNKEMSYTNGCISEYVACHIFEMLGFRVQDTLLGNYTDSRGKSKLVVACRDFTEGGKRLIEFAQLKNTCIDSEQNGYGKELDSILEAVNEQTLYPADELRAFFWDMFIADAFLGNFDRHNGNWGLLVNEEEQSVEIAPIYDCGSCLYPQLDLPHMAEVLNSQEEIDRRIYVFPASAVEEHGVKIPYFDFISSLRCPECNDALRRVTARIDLDRIQKFLDGVPELQPIQREFYLTMLTERKEKILDYSLDLLLREEQQPGAPELTMGPAEYSGDRISLMRSPFSVLPTTTKPRGTIPMRERTEAKSENHKVMCQDNLSRGRLNTAAPCLLETVDHDRNHSEKFGGFAE